MRNNSIRLAIAGLTLVMVGCATPAQRITKELVQIGIPEPQARCVGERLADRLSRDQLKRLVQLAQAAKSQGGSAGGTMSLNQIARQFNQPGDKKLVSEVLRTGISCAI